MKRILDLEVESMRAYDRIKFLENKHEQNKLVSEALRKELNRYKNQVEKMNSLPIVRSNSLIVS